MCNHWNDEKKTRFEGIKGETRAMRTRDVKLKARMYTTVYARDVVQMGLNTTPSMRK